jgi:N-acetylglucosaminyl-diphospho-decaprenol L-rhamnosyltransferase
MSIEDNRDGHALLDIVIVNWNTGNCLRACLNSLATAGSGLRLGKVVVVDNASRDGSVEQLPAHPDLVLLRNPENVGFAAACNQGSRVGSAPYLLFLNPDTALLPDTLRSALIFMEGPEGARYDICGGSVLNVDGTPGISASRFPTLANVMTGTLGLDRFMRRLVAPRHLQADEMGSSGPVDQVIGAFFLVRRSLFERLQGFDERYYLYYEEVDFCMRAASLGARAFLHSETTLHHVGNVSAKQSGGRALFHSLRSRTLYAARHWSMAHVIGLVIFTLLVEIPARLLRAAVRLNLGEAIAVGRVLGCYLMFVARATIQRGSVQARPARVQRGPSPTAEFEPGQRRRR